MGLLSLAADGMPPKLLRLIRARTMRPRSGQLKATQCSWRFPLAFVKNAYSPLHVRLVFWSSLARYPRDSSWNQRSCVRPLLRIKTSKTKMMSPLISGERSQCVLLDGEPLEEVDKLQHLDSTRFTYKQCVC